MSRKKKVVILLHLIFALFYLCWVLFQPTIQEILSTKAEYALFEAVFDHQELFKNLSLDEQTVLLEGFEKEREKPSINLVVHFFTKSSPFILFWLALSFTLSSLFLFNVKGTTQAAWLLPIAILVYGYFSYATPPPLKALSLFPTEEYVLTNYADDSNPLLAKRREELLKGWHRYLITEWGQERPDQEEFVLKQQLDRALFAFNVERLNLLISGKEDDLILAGLSMPPSLIQLSFYFLWNLFFAWFLNRKETFLKSVLPSPAN